MSCQKPKNSTFKCPVEANFCGCQEGYEFGGAGWTCPYLKNNVVLKVPIRKKWFDRIALGLKKVEYREYKPFWISRIEDRNYDFIEFRQGYKKDSRKMTVVWKGYSVIEGVKTPLGTGKQFAINLGEIIR